MEGKHSKPNAAGGPVGRAIVREVKCHSAHTVAPKVIGKTTVYTLADTVADHSEAFAEKAKGYPPLGKHGYCHPTAKHSLGSTPTGRTRSGTIKSCQHMDPVSESDEKCP